MSELEDCYISVVVRCCCYKLVAEAEGQIGNLEEGECPLLGAVTRRLVKTQQTKKT
jgi:hypothetical protein